MYVGHARHVLGASAAVTATSALFRERKAGSFPKGTSSYSAPCSRCEDCTAEFAEQFAAQTAKIVRTRTGRAQQFAEQFAEQFAAHDAFLDGSSTRAPAYTRDQFEYAEFDPFAGMEQGWIFDPFAGPGRGTASFVLADRPAYHWLPFWQGHVQTHGIPFSSAAVMLAFVDRYSLRRLPRIAPGIASIALLSCLLEKAWRAFKEKALSGPCRDVAIETDGCRIAAADVTFDIDWTCASMQGWRPSMEDAHISQIISDKSTGRVLGVFGVFDGHGGWEVAAVVRDLLPQMLSIGFSKLGKSASKASVAKLLTETVESVDLELKGGPMGFGHLLKDEGHSFLHPFARTGSTACVAVLDVHNGQLVVANTGDSRAVLCRGGRAVPLTSDHNIQIPEEAQRIVKAGGRIIKDGSSFRVDGGLNMSRALGDFGYKADSTLATREQKIIATPTITSFSWSPSDADDFLVVACDGVFERMSRDEVVEHIQKGLDMGAHPEHILQGMLQHSCANYPWEDGQDNQSALLVQWQSIED